VEILSEFVQSLEICMSDFSLLWSSYGDLTIYSVYYLKMAKLVFIIIELIGQIMTPMYKVSLLNTARLIIKYFQLFYFHVTVHRN